MAKVDLVTRIKGIEFRNPLTVASGTFGVRDEMEALVPYEKIGAIITKTITVNPRKGNPMPRICETTGGMLNAIGLQNKGLQDFIENKIPYFAKVKTPLIVNIAGEAAGDFETLAKALDKQQPVIKALELNLSCPNVEAGGVSFMRKRERIVDAVKAVRDATRLPLFAKLSPELGDVVDIAGELIRAGVDGLSLINTLKGMAIDVRTRKSRLANVTGGLSGPAIKPVALRYLYEVRKHYDVPIIASGGIATGRDAVEFLILGASLLAVGTATFANPRAVLDILKDLTVFCAEEKLTSIDALRGSFVDFKKAHTAECGG